MYLTDQEADLPHLKPKHSALMYEEHDGTVFWFTVLSSELGEILGL